MGSNQKGLKKGRRELIKVEPLTESQVIAFQCYDWDRHLLLHGSAGTGKTFISMYLALRDVLDGRYDQLIIFRSVVTTRDIGHLPGTLQEKTCVFERPYRELCAELTGKFDSYNTMKKGQQIDFAVTSFVRGITLKNCVVLVDEVQNMNDHEIKSILTRLDDNSRVIMCGDFGQSDFNPKKEQSGINKMIQVARRMDSFEDIQFGVDDIVRSGFVKEYLIARNDLQLD